MPSQVTAQGTVLVPPIAEIQVAGFKSITDKQKIEIKPLTILAGANSSGKSSMMQPLLLLKQTLEAGYDPGPIMLNGPILKFTSADQLLSRISNGQSLGNFETGMRLDSGHSFVTRFGKEHKTGFQIERTETSWERGRLAYWPDMTEAEIVKTFKKNGIDLSGVIPENYRQGQWQIRRDRCFIGPVWVAKGAPSDQNSVVVGARPGAKWEEIIPHVIHVPGLRGNLERIFPVTAVGSTYSGTFEKYSASIISQWMDEGEEVLAELNADLKLLKLTGGVTAIRPNDAQIELHVGRLPDLAPTRPEDRVNIADVGIGVSQTLPILVALRAAKPGQLVYIEQPETHLHPRAQFALAEIVSSAAKQGVRVVVETHSAILLLGVQTQVAENHLEPDKVKLHWFERDKSGRTIVRPGILDDAGRFGDWPEDFDDVALKNESRYLNAAEARVAAK